MPVAVGKHSEMPTQGRLSEIIFLPRDGLSVDFASDNTYEKQFILPLLMVISNA